MESSELDCHRLPQPLPRHLIFDLDGTLVRGWSAVPGAVEVLRQAGARAAVLSNNSSHSAAEIAERLSAIGLPLPPARIVTAGMSAVQLIAREHPRARVMIAGSPSLAAAARACGIRPVARGAELVLLGRFPAFGYDDIARIANALRDGARLIVTNPDMSHPGADGRLVPETGALMAAVLACCSSSVDVTVVGKPEPHLFREALARLDAAPADCLMVGDNPLTDGEGARRIGMPSLIVGPGGRASLFDLLDRLTGDEAGSPEPASALSPKPH